MSAPWRLWQRNRLAVGWLLLFFLATPASALNPARTVFQYNCQTWRRQNGLPANAVDAIAQTRDGYIWLGTALGLVRFDGVEFKLLDMGSVAQARSTLVSSLASCRRGGLWFGLEHGAFGYSSGTTISFLGKPEWGGVHLNVHSILETRDEDLWIAAETLAARLAAEKTYESILPTSTNADLYDVTALCEDSQGRIWLGTARRGLYCWQKGALTRLPDPALDQLIVRALAEDKRGRIWVGTEVGLLCYDSDFRRQPLPFPWYETRALLVDRHGAVWVGTSGGGLVRYLDDQLTQFRRSDGLADDFVISLAEDEEGSLWVGTRNGLTQLSDVKIPTFGKTEGISGDVSVDVCASPRGGLWVATDAGFTHFNAAPDNYSTNVGLATPYIKRIFEARNGDVYLIDGKMNVEIVSGGKVVACYPNARWPTAMTEDADGVVVAVAGQLYRVGTNYYRPYAFEGDQRPPTQWVFNLATDRDGTIWMACGEGLCRVKDGAYTLYTAEQGLSDSKVMSVCPDTDGVVWAGLETGMARIKNGRVNYITREDGLFGNIIYAIVSDDHGFLWVDSSRGIFRVQRKVLNDFCDRQTNRVDCLAYDGLESVKGDEKNQQQQAGCRTLDGRIWFPTAQGIVMIDPTNLASNPVPPKVHIQSASADGRELDLTGKAVVLPGKGDLEFHYAGLSYIAPQKIRYRYRLTGYDPGWVDAGTRRTVFYTNLKPGEYRFLVEACNEDGVWATAGTGFTVQLLPHLYQTPWFTASMGLLAVFALFGVYAWRLRHLDRKQRRLQEAHDLLESQVRERTLELAESNRHLIKEIEERSRVEREIEQVHRQLVDASRLAGQAEVASSVLHNVGNVLNSVNVSTSVITDRLGKIQPAKLARAARLLKDHSDDIARFLSTDKQGRQLPRYLEEFSHHLGQEQTDLLAEIANLAHNVDHIKDIVAMQQNYAKVSGVAEKVAVADLVESALRMHAGAYERHSIQVHREFEVVPLVVVDRHKVLQILVNILHNAKYACDEANPPEKKVVVRIKSLGPRRLRIEVTDNGVGIPPENMTRIFAHGFTTRKGGHGFGLHSAALAATEMGGSLAAESEGVGKGAMFILELPVYPPGRMSAPGLHQVSSHPEGTP